MIVLDIEQTGKNIKALRESHNIKISKLSEMIGVAKAPIYRWEDGSHVPTVDHLVFLSELYGVPIDAIVARKEV